MPRMIVWPTLVRTLTRGALLLALLSLLAAPGARAAQEASVVPFHTLPIGLQYGGSGGPVEYINGLIYFAQGSALNILDSSLPYPERLSFLVVPGPIWSMHISGGYAYLGLGEDGLAIANIQNPARPYMTLHYKTQDAVRSVWAANGYLYVTDEKGLSIYHMPDPSHLTLVKSIPLGFGGGTVITHENIAYVATLSDGMHIYKISDPAQPTLVKKLQVNSSLNSMTISGGYLYAIQGLYNLDVYNISDPKNPVLANRVNNVAMPSHISVSGSRVYLADRSHGYVVIVSNNVGSMSILGGFTTNAHRIYAAAGNGNMVYVATEDRGVYIVDASAVKDLKLSGGYGDLGMVTDVTVSSGLLFTSSPDQTTWLDLSDTDRPVSIKMDHSNSGRISSGENYLFIDKLESVVLGDGSGGTEPYLFIYRTSAGFPEYVGKVPIGWALRGVQVRNGYAYVITGRKLLTVALSGTPQVVSSEDMWDPDEIRIRGNRLYVFHYFLKEYDLTDPANPKLITTSALSSEHETQPFSPTAPEIESFTRASFDFCGEYIVSVYTDEFSYSSLWVNDIETREELSREDSIPGVYRQVACYGRYAFVAGGSAGLVVYEIADPAKPEKVAVFPTGGTRVLISGDTVYVAGRYHGLFRFSAREFNTNLSGRVRHLNGTPYSGKVALDVNGRSLFTLADGSYAFTSLPPGTTTITPALAGYTFFPASNQVVVPPEKRNSDFILLPQTVSTEYVPGVSATLELTGTYGSLTRLELPAGASPDPLMVTLAARVPSTIGSLAPVGYAYEIGPALPGFSAPLALSIYYDTSDLSRVRGEEALRLLHWNGSAWVDGAETCTPKSTYQRDPRTNFIRLDICASGRYTLVGESTQLFLPQLVSGYSARSALLQAELPLAGEPRAILPMP